MSGSVSTVARDCRPHRRRTRHNLQCEGVRTVAFLASCIVDTLRCNLYCPSTPRVAVLQRESDLEDPWVRRPLCCANPASGEGGLGIWLHVG